MFVGDSEEPFYQGNSGNPAYADFDMDTAFVRGQTTLGPHSWRNNTFGSHLYVDGGTGRGMQIAVHEFMHTMGMAHVAGNPGGTNTVTLQPSGEDYSYPALNKPNCEVNAVGIWYCGGLNVAGGYCDDSELCCGTAPASNATTYLDQSGEPACGREWPLPSAYTPTYAEAHGNIIDTWMYLNDVVPTEVAAPNDTCAGHWDEYNCWDQAGCFWDQVSAATRERKRGFSWCGEQRRRDLGECEQNVPTPYLRSLRSRA